MKMPYHRGSVHSNGYSPEGQQAGRDRDESPTYLMEHLATFTVSKETGIVYPADGMRRLLQLEKSNGIWSQKMQLRLDTNLVLIIDYETGTVMEKFPATLIQEPTAFNSSDPVEIYNNILVFIVGDDHQPNSHSEMHIFQCQMISAQELVEDLKLLRAGKTPGPRGRHIPPPPPTPPPEPPLNGVNVREQVSVFNAASQSEGRGGSDVGGVSHDDETSSTSSDKYGRDVTTLNHCFDDIEKFIARLQHSAAASRELERRRKKSRKKNMGDGMLTMRAKPPPEAEFIDIFQKFKLSFILLAKLKQHIHDPNAPELVHFLFTPLALIVDASHDTNYGTNLPAKVISPLLTQEAIHLLINCVTSKETELWHSLGEAWLVPREQWKGYIEPYHPVFLDGWSPDYPVLEERDDRRELAHSAQSVVKPDIRSVQPDLRDMQYNRDRDRDDLHYSSDYFEFERQEPQPADLNRYPYDTHNYSSRNDHYSRDERVETHSPSDSEPGPPPPPPRSDISADSIERTGPGNANGGIRFERAQSLWLEELRTTGAKIVQVTYPRTANNDKELSVVRGEYLKVLDDSRKWWKTQNSRGDVAHVPHTIVTPYQPNDPNDVFGSAIYSRGYYHSQEDRVNHRGNGGMIPVPPPAPTAQPAPAPAEWVRKERLVTRTKEDALQSELRALFNPEKEKINVIKTPSVFINSESTASEVQHWLKAKHFNSSVCKQFEGMSSQQLFNLNKDELIQRCGNPEGKRLYSQLLVQRNVSGYKTTRCLELCEKLAKARKKYNEIDYDSETSNRSG